MKHIVKEIIFTDKTKDGEPLINRARMPFFMLHIKLEDDTWVSKYYTSDKDKEMLLKEIEVGEEYDIEIKISGQYKNIIQLRKNGNVII